MNIGYGAVGVDKRKPLAPAQGREENGACDHLRTQGQLDAGEVGQWLPQSRGDDGRRTDEKGDDGLDEAAGRRACSAEQDRAGCGPRCCRGDAGAPREYERAQAHREAQEGQPAGGLAGVAPTAWSPVSTIVNEEQNPTSVVMGPAMAARVTGSLFVSPRMKGDTSPIEQQVER